MNRSLALLTAALLACAPSLADAQNNGTNAMTDCTFGGGNSITLAPVGSGTVLVRAQNVMPKTTAYIQNGYCRDQRHSRAYPLRTLANGVSETKLPTVSLEQLHANPHSLVLARPGRGSVLECGDIGKPSLLSK